MRFWVLAVLVILSFLISVFVACAALLTINSIPGGTDEIPADFMSLVTGGGSPTWPWLFICCGFVALTQGAFLVPTFSPMQSTGQPRSLLWSVVGAAGMAAALSAAWIVAFITTIELYTDFRKTNFSLLDSSILPVSFVVALIVGWVFWSCIFFKRALRAEVPEAWLLRRMFAATALLIVGTIPLDVMVRRKTSCYCGEGSFFALIWGVGGVYWILGPFAFLGKSRKMRRSLRGVFCVHCGQARGPNANAICPECGRMARGSRGQNTAPLTEQSG